MRGDNNGEYWESAVDIAFVAYDVYSLINDNGWKEWENWATLGVDSLFTLLPVVTGGGQIVKLANVTDDLKDLSKVTVVGETMSRVNQVAKTVNATDNLYQGFKSYRKWAAQGIVGKTFAEIIGKSSNAFWLYGKLRSGYKVIDIGIDITRETRSSSYMLERAIMSTWRYRNLWKLSIHD